MKYLAALLPIVALLSACILSVPPTDTREPVHVQALVDVSGSYELRAEALATLTALIDQLEGGDALTVRSLASVSHREGGVLLDAKIPEVGAEPARMDLRRVAEYRQRLASVDSTKSLLRARIGEIADIPNAARTDIVGGLVVAAEALRYGGPNRSGVLVIFTDGIDNGPNNDARVAIDMSDLHVVFAHFDPAGTLEEKLRLGEQWTRRISGDWVANSVEFLPPTSSLDLGRYRSAPGDRGELSS